MSFAYLPLYTGDYLRATRHLTPEEHGIYLLLLMHSWDSKMPVPLDERKQFGLVNARSGGEIESLRRVLQEFFVRMEDGWYNKRIFEEIERSNAISTKRSDAARVRWKARETVRAINGKASEMQMHSKSIACAPSPSPSPSLTPEEDTARKRAARAAHAVTVDELIKDGIPEAMAGEWIAHRKRKRAVLTATAWDGIKRQAGKAGYTLEAAVSTALRRGWTSFEAAWVENEPKVRPNDDAERTNQFLAELKAHKGERPPPEVLRMIKGAVK